MDYVVYLMYKDILEIERSLYFFVQNNDKILVYGRRGKKTINFESISYVMMTQTKYKIFVFIYIRYCVWVFLIFCILLKKDKDKKFDVFLFYLINLKLCSINVCKEE